MSYDEYYIDIPSENTINPFSTISNNTSNLTNSQQYQFNNNTFNILNNSNTTIPISTHNNIWIPSDTFWRIYHKFQSTILKEYPDTPCVYCGRLLYKNKANWIAYDPIETYPIEQYNQINVLTSYSMMKNQILKIPSCHSCTKPENRFLFPLLAEIPNEIEAIPLHRRKFLSPIYLHCSLGRNSDSNNLYSEYRSIVGTMGYSVNFRALALYSGIIGAYLQPLNPNHVPNEEIFDDILSQAATWLSLHNPYLRNYTNALNQRSTTNMTGPFPTAAHIPNDNNAPPVNQRDIIIPTINLPDEVHNEDFHYSRLMAGFVHNNDNNKLPISIYDPNLEPLLFPHLFPNGKGHFHDMREHAQENDNRVETLGKYAK